MQFLLLLAQTHENFRVAELEAIADLYNIELDLSHHDKSSPFLIIELKNCEEAKKLVERTILCRSIYELYGYGTDLDSLHEQIQRKGVHQWVKHKTCSFKFDIISYQGSRMKKEQLAMINSFAYMGLEGPIKMKSPDETFTILEDYELDSDSNRMHSPRQIYFGRFITESSRQVVDKYDLKKRKYIGTTSFEAELALVTCNIAQVTPGRIVYDPFAGTGSFLVSASHFGASSIGSDIDPRMLRGKGKANIDANFKQYGTSGYYLDVLAMDFTHNALRTSLKLDSIICDPPYGVREGLKVLGAKDPEKFKNKDDVFIDGVAAHLRKDYIAPKKPYQFGSLLDDLLEFAAQSLPELSGRLCCWIPTPNEQFDQCNDIPLHPDLQLIHDCVQEFNKWSRRLLVYRRRPNGEKGKQLSVKGNASEEFREKYFRGFIEKE